MKKQPGNSRRKAPDSIPCLVRVLADWWTRPEAARTAVWNTSQYWENVMLLWQQNLDDSGKAVEALLSALALEQRELPPEYERLFVGPAAAPCPPYEAVWRNDRPTQEQGTVMGQSTLQVQRLYSELGVRLAPDQVELADHIAVELEALAYAWSIGDEKHANGLVLHLREWLPPFCESVSANSQAEFYVDLAKVTMDFFSRSRPGNPGPVRYAGMGSVDISV